MMRLRTKNDARTYTPTTIGDWVAVNERDYPWNTIGSALEHSAGKGRKTQNLMTAAEVLDATGLNVEVRKTQVLDPETKKPIPHLFATHYDDAEVGRVYFGAVSDKYEVVQPVESLSFFDNVIQQVDGAHYSAAWNMREKSMFGVTIELPDEIVVDPQGADDRIGLHLLGVNSFDGSTALFGALEATRFFCMNQLPAILKNAKRRFSLRHTKNVRTRTSDAAAMIGVTLDYAKALDRVANKLYTLPMGDDAFDKFLARLTPFALDGSETDLKKARILERRTEARMAWEAPHNENIRGTKWGALNVVSEFTEWGRAVKGSSRTGTDATRQRAIGTLVHPTVAGTFNEALAVLNPER